MDLLAEIEAEATNAGITIGTAIVARLRGTPQAVSARPDMPVHVDAQVIADKDARIAGLEAELAKARKDLATAKADKAMVVAKGFPVERGSPEHVRVDPARHHPAGPVLASAVPVIEGTTGWCGLKGGKKKGA